MFKKFWNWNKNKQWWNEIEIFSALVGYRLCRRNVNKCTLIIIYYVLKNNEINFILFTTWNVVFKNYEPKYKLIGEMSV